MSGTTHSLPWLPLHSHPRAASKVGWQGPGEQNPSSTWVWLEQPLKVDSDGEERALSCGLHWKLSPWSPLEQTGSFPPHGPEASSQPTQWTWPAGPKLPRKVAGRWDFLGAWLWFPPGIASTSVFLRPFLCFQAKVCCWFLSPLVPTHPGTCLLACWVRL